MATVCLAYGMTPTEYRNLTALEQRTLIAVMKEAGKGG